MSGYNVEFINPFSIFNELVNYSLKIFHELVCKLNLLIRCIHIKQFLKSIDITFLESNNVSIKHVKLLFNVDFEILLKLKLVFFHLLDHIVVELVTCYVVTHHAHQSELLELIGGFLCK